MSLSINKSTRKLYILFIFFLHWFLAYTHSYKHVPKEAPLCNLLSLSSSKSNKGKSGPIRETFLKASYTVEAAFILPLSLMMVVFCLYFFRVLYVQWGIDYTINKVARQHSAVITDQGGDDGLLVLGESYALIGADERVRKEIVGGLIGLNFTESEFDRNYIDITCRYKLKNPITMFGIKNIDMVSTTSARKWIGFDPHEDDSGGEYVYVTKYGSAYHKSLACPYLKPSVRAVSADAVKDERSVSGGKYSSCPICKGKKNSGSVYITDYGDVYHSSLTCSGLKRSIKRIKLGDASDYHACGKCAS